MLGEVLDGRYRIVDVLGRGGIAIVYRAQQLLVHERDVAVKILTSTRASTAQRFETEARIIARLRHPNTLKLLDSGRTPDGRLYLVTECLHGTSLAQRLADGPISALATVRIMAQVAEALIEAHEEGVIHRDLKPGNIFLEQVGSQEVVKVLDFGIAKVFRGEKKIDQLETQAGTVFGTPRYMSPEQAQGLMLDGRSDLYTLGVVLYELLTGEALFTADSMVALLVKHIAQAPPPLREVRPDLKVDPRLEAVVMRALAKEPEERYSSVDALAQALEPFAYATQRPQPALPGEPARIPPNTTPPPEVQSDELGALLTDFLQDLTPLEHLDVEPESPFRGYTPLPEEPQG
ncbi:MAG: serine/threonine protein kinase [Myxococcales bacterium]|nr:serine/threonine protein kinase [Myxococcales bacterium]